MPKRSSFRLKNWQGDDFKGSGVEAARLGINDTMADCIKTSKPLTPVLTGTAQGSIRIVDAAEIKGDRVKGRWGSTDVNYFIFLEIGARGRSGIHMLRRGADANYPALAERIREHWEKLT